ncbi:MAG: hypothetical protein KGM98_10095 [Bacteroidota bacterium]|nr:hypothetical protein [Bacteroidota bacterium]
MRKTTAIFLFALLGLNSFGLFFFFWGEIQLCKIRAEDYSGEAYNLPAASYTVFISGVADFKKINSHEIQSDGKLYDIVRTRIHHGKTVYYTFHDSEEDRYTRDLSQWGNSNSQENSLPGKTLVLQLAKFFTRQTPFSGKPRLFECTASGFLTAKNVFLYTSPTLSVELPPPNLS